MSVSSAPGDVDRSGLAGPGDAAAVLDALGDGICVIDAGWHVVYANATLDTLLPPAVPSPLGAKLASAYPSLLTPEIESVALLAMLDRVPQRANLPTPQGILELRLRPYGTDGLVLHVIATPISTMLLHQLKLAFQAMGMGVWTYDVAPGQKFFVEAQRAPYFIAPEPGIDGVTDYFAGASEEMRALAEARFQAALRPEGTGLFTHEQRTPAGRWTLIKGKVQVDAAQRPSRMMVASVDVTSRREAEEAHAAIAQHLREANDQLEIRVAERTTELRNSIAELEQARSLLGKMLDAIPVGISVVELDGTYRYRNTLAGRLIGFPATNIQALTASGEMGPLRLDGSKIAHEDLIMVRALRTGQPVQREIQKFRLPDGTIRLYEGSAVPIRDAQDNLLYVLATTIDITERQAAEEALRQTQRLEAMGQLTGGIAHDFNNLLTAVLGNLELLKRRLADSPHLRLVNNAFQAADRGSKLTGQLLAFSRRQALVTQLFDANDLVRAAADLLRSSLGGAIEIQLRLADERLPCLADPTHLEAAIANLAFNARDAMPAGGTLHLTTTLQHRGQPERSEHPAAGTFVAIALIDTGHGMEPDILGRAFEPFFTTKELGRGSGLGLPHALGLAKQLGGGIEITSTPGLGTAVTIFLPLAEVPALAAEPAREAVRRAEALSGMNVLVIDDDADVLQAVGGLLAGCGATVHLADSGAAGHGLVLDGLRPDAALIDFAMPGMNGLGAAERLEAQVPHLAVVLMTGNRDAVSPLPPGRELPILRKPFRTAEMIATLTSAVAARTSK